MNRLRDKLAKINMDISDSQLEQFKIYYDMLIDKNKVMNLTAITDLDQVIDKHFVDSVMLGKNYDLSGNISLIDVGTGAGFPGIPLKIMYPELRVTLLDSLNKRVLFLQEVIDTLELSDIEAVHYRAEEGARDARYREHFDVCVSRAVANLSALSEYCIPYVKPGGYFISYKSGEVEEEIVNAKNAIHLLGGKYDRCEKMSIPDTDIARSFVYIKKGKNTPKTYPRKPGTATKSPL